MDAWIAHQIFIRRFNAAMAYLLVIGTLVT
jgi:hypothetical protein